MAKNEFWKKKHDIWHLKLKNQNSSKMGSPLVKGLLHKTSNRFSTYLCRDRSILKMLSLVLCKCSTFDNWIRKSNDFLKNSITLISSFGDCVQDIHNMDSFGLLGIYNWHLPKNPHDCELQTSLVSNDEP